MTNDEPPNFRATDAVMIRNGLSSLEVSCPNSSTSEVSTSVGIVSLSSQSPSNSEQGSQISCCEYKEIKKNDSYEIKFFGRLKMLQIIIVE